jgi:hypothetical protein
MLIVRPMIAKRYPLGIVNMFSVLRLFSETSPDLIKLSLLTSGIEKASQRREI